MGGPDAPLEQRAHAVLDVPRPSGGLEIGADRKPKAHHRSIGQHHLVLVARSRARLHEQFGDRQVEIHGLTARRALQHAREAITERRAAQVQQQRLAIAAGEAARELGAAASPTDLQHAAPEQPGDALRPGDVVAVEEPFLVSARRRAHSDRAIDAPVHDHPVRESRPRHQGATKLGSAGSGTSRSRSMPSFSSLMCWMATALALASRSGSG